MKETFIIDGCRTAVGSLGGSLSSIRTDDLAAHTLRELYNRYPVLNNEKIDDVILGCANQAGEDNRNVARMALLLAGIPQATPGETVNRLCASGMSAVINAHRAIQCGDGDIYLAGGVEGMTRGPWVISKTSTAYGRDAKMYDSTFGWRFINSKMEDSFGCDSMGGTAENLAQMFNISREDQDQFALWSQKKYAKAADAGIFKDEIIPIEIPIGKNESKSFQQDEFAKSNTTLEGLAKLKPAFSNNGTVTAGNSSGLNDGSASLLIMSEEATAKNNFTPLARIISSAVVGVEPRIMGIGPVEATKKVLSKSKLSLDQIDIIEINEAFAAQVLACTRSLNLMDNDDRINPNGGAIAIGHPLGMTGARIMLTAALQLKRTNKKYALCTMCIGVGQGYAVIIERI